MIFLAVFIISLAWYLIDSSRWDYRVLFFPDNIAVGVSGELRKIPNRGSREKNLEQLIKELFLGPQDVQNGRLFPRDTRLLSLIYREGVVDIDFSVELLLPDEEVKLSIVEILSLTEDTINYNYPSIKKVHFTILGEPVRIPEKNSGKG